MQCIHSAHLVASSLGTKVISSTIAILGLSTELSEIELGKSMNIEKNTSEDEALSTII